jgi:hypothetical protein
MNDHEEELARINQLLGIDIKTGQPNGNGILGKLDKLTGQIDKLQPINMIKTLLATASLVSGLWALVVLVVQQANKG